jgi:hypothetical protein|tara:strand:+ start:87 stop:212 length:126 start_codon:yes stop_codon:yes gene_type:complete
MLEAKIQSLPSTTWGVEYRGIEECKNPVAGLFVFDEYLVKR